MLGSILGSSLELILGRGKTSPEQGGKSRIMREGERKRERKRRRGAREEPRNGALAWSACNGALARYIVGPVNFVSDKKLPPYHWRPLQLHFPSLVLLSGAGLAGGSPTPQPRLF